MLLGEQVYESHTQRDRLKIIMAICENGKLIHIYILFFANDTCKLCTKRTFSYACQRERAYHVVLIYSTMKAYIYRYNVDNETQP